ncbi:MAG: hypothetical protein HQK96_10235 [Nitrospirae bacterium]|nr:hypothetical protein [Nitrospirota bacterium]
MTEKYQGDNSDLLSQTPQSYLIHRIQEHLEHDRQMAEVPIVASFYEIMTWLAIGKFRIRSCTYSAIAFYLNSLIDHPQQLQKINELKHHIAKHNSLGIRKLILSAYINFLTEKLKMEKDSEMKERLTIFKEMAEDDRDDCNNTSADTTVSLGGIPQEFWPQWFSETNN